MRFNRTVGSVDIRLNTDKFDRNMMEAQKKLDIQVLSDSNLYIPQQQGSLLASGNIVKDGEIAWNTPYAHYQYIGELYLTEDGRSFANRGERKFPTGISLKQSTGMNPLASAHWFEEAKEQNLNQWLDLVKRTAGKE